MDTPSLHEKKHVLEKALDFVSSSGFSTSGLLAKPSYPTTFGVILCHGFLSDKNSRTNRRLTELLVRQGIATLRFDWYGMGETQELFSQISLRRCEEQLEAAFHAIQQHGLTRLGLIGSSFGGLLAMLSAPNQTNLFALGLKCPVVDFPEVLRQEFGSDAMAHWQSTNYIPDIRNEAQHIFLPYTFYEECLRYNVYTTIQKIRAPTLVVHGEKDELIPPSQIDRLLETLTSQKQLQLISGADHQFGRPEDFRLMTNHLAQWMTAHLTEQ